MKDRIFKDFIGYLPARVIPPLLALFSIPIFTRVLSTQQYGAYVIALTTLTLIGSLYGSWLGSIVIRFRSSLDENLLKRTCFIFGFISTIIASFSWIIVAYIQGYPFSSVQYLLPGLIWIIVYIPFEYIVSWFRAENRTGAFTWALCWRAFGGLVMPIPILLMFKVTGEAILWSGGLTMLAAIMYWYCFTQRRILLDNLKSFRSSDKIEFGDTYRKLLQYGLPAAITNFALVGLSLSDRYIISAFIGLKEVAIYGASYDIAEKTIFFLNTMMLLSSTVMAVQIFEKEGDTKSIIFLQEILRIYLLLVMPVVFIVTGLSNDLVRLILPDTYMEGNAVIPIIVASAALVGIMHRYSIILSLHKRTDLLMWSTISALLVKLASSYLLVPMFGIEGAAYATLIGYAAWLAFVRIMAARFAVPTFPWASLVRTSIAGGLAGWTTLIVPDFGAARLPIAASCAMGVYALALVVTREVKGQELYGIRRVLLQRLGKPRG